MKEGKLTKYNHAPERTHGDRASWRAPARRTTMVQNARSLGITHQLEYVEGVFYNLSTGSEEIWARMLRDVALRILAAKFGSVARVIGLSRGKERS